LTVSFISVEAICYIFNVTIIKKGVVMNRCCYLFVFIFVSLSGSYMFGMEELSYENLKKASTPCTRFGLEILERLDSMIYDLQKNKTSYPVEKYDEELTLLNRYKTDIEWTLIASSFCDEMEQVKNYKCKKAFYSFKKRFVSDIVWDQLLNDLKKNRETSCSNYRIFNNGAIEFHNVYYAAIVFEDMTEKRENMHKEFGFDAFRKGTQKRLNSK